MFGRRSNSNQARICVLRFSANMVWLVSCLYIFILLHYYKTREISIPMINTIRLGILLWLSGLRRRSVDSEVQASQVQSPPMDFFLVNWKEAARSY